jgi:hypothetical protein
MGLVSNKISFTRSNSGNSFAKHHPIYLRQTLMDGKILVYDEGKAFNEYERRNHGAERMEISIPEGKVCVIKDYDVDPKELRYRGIECFSTSGELLDTINIMQEPLITYTPSVKFYYGNAGLGRGSGNIGMFIAQKLFGEGIMDPRYVTGSQVSEEVITLLFRIYNRKMDEIPEQSKNIRSSF